jgi:hypothetical protein
VTLQPGDPSYQRARLVGALVGTQHRGAYATSARFHNIIDTLAACLPAMVEGIAQQAADDDARDLAETERLKGMLAAGQILLHPEPGERIGVLDDMAARLNDLSVDRRVREAVAAGHVIPADPDAHAWTVDTDGAPCCPAPPAAPIHALHAVGPHAFINDGATRLCAVSTCRRPLDDHMHHAAAPIRLTCPHPECVGHATGDEPSCYPGSRMADLFPGGAPHRFIPDADSRAAQCVHGGPENRCGQDSRHPIHVVTVVTSGDPDDKEPPT